MGNIEAQDNNGNVSGKSNMGKVVIRGTINGAVEGISNMGKIEFNNPEALSEYGKSQMGKVSRTPGIAEGSCSISLKQH